MLSIIVSVFNEEEVLQHFYNELISHISFIEDAEIIFVNDGSTDNTRIILNQFAEQDSRVIAIHFSRNFGHEAAMIAGLKHCTGEAIICMDADLQHPPSKIQLMYEAYKSGNDIVLMIRDERKDYNFLKQWFTSFFYYILNTLSEYRFSTNASDFFLISSRVGKVVTSEFNEYNKFLRGIIQNIGFKSCNIHYIAPKRFAGKSKYSIYKLILFSFSAISTTSLVPLRLGIFAGITFGIFSIVLSIYSIVMKLYSQPTAGYTTLIVFLSLSFSLLFFIIGIIGEYLANIFKEVKNRPSYIIEKITKQKN
jgi:glycosyltransferase involved in cell wall biosynthesis